jgi:hypothetical protein
MAIRQLSDGNDSGTLLGQSASDKIGFYGLATPIVQPSAIADATDAATAITKVNAVIAALESLGLIAS